MSYRQPLHASRRRRWLVRGAVGAAVLAAAGALLLTRQRRVPRPPPSTAAFFSGPGYVPVGSGGIEVSLHGNADGTGPSNAWGVPYGRFFFVRDGNTVAAIRILDGQSDPVRYEWWCRSDGTSHFGTPGDTRGTGTASEASRNPWIVAGPMRIEWSQGGPHVGWLYWPADRPRLQLSSEVSDSPAAAGRDPSSKWYSQQGPFP